ncbi:MAG: fasciclin domain-containing protein [Rhodobacteraceae bacterium]|nr:MAG: fasciclin domain-containing protein [Paracoccaceae bacterium]
MKKTLLAALSVSVLSAGAAMAARGDILETAEAAGTFQTLLSAAEAAGFAETLRGDGPFTVFAPTDEAFAALPEGTVESLLDPANRDELRALVGRHVVRGALPSAEIEGLAFGAGALSGETIVIDNEDRAAVRVGSAQVVAADIEAENGVIHVIDSVLLDAS